MSTKSKFKPNYTTDEIDALIDYYSERSAVTHKLTWLVRYCDLYVALQHMPEKQYEAIYFIGLCTIPLRAAAKHMQVSKDTAWRRYTQGLEWIANFLNTGESYFKQEDARGLSIRRVRNQRVQ